jgi:4,5-dihydroxyphthalate decarboxylase
VSGENHLDLVMAISDSDHVRDLVSGVVPVEGINLNCLHFDVEEIFFRFTRHREWHISEMSMGKLAALRALDDDLIGIPVFLSRMFRHSALYIRPDGPIDDPGALRGGRIGIPEWTVTATVYGRDLLAKEYGVGLKDVEWVQGGTNEPGRIETLSTAVPDGVRITPVTDRSLPDLLLAGEIDAILAPHAPAAFDDGHLIRLFTDTQTAERDYYARTGIFPIMHAVVLRGDVYREHPWIAANLVSAFTAAKERAVARALDVNASRVPIAWANSTAQATVDQFGGDPWPYGLEANRVTLEAFLAMCHEQRVTERLLEPEDLFAVETHQRFRI